MVSGPPRIVYQPPPVYPERNEDPAVADAIRKQLAIERGVAGRAATMLGGGTVSPLINPTPTTKAGARLLGEFGRLGGTSQVANTQGAAA